MYTSKSFYYRCKPSSQTFVSLHYIIIIIIIIIILKLYFNMVVKAKQILPTIAYFPLFS